MSLLHFIYREESRIFIGLVNPAPRTKIKKHLGIDVSGCEGPVSNKALLFILFASE